MLMPSSTLLRPHPGKTERTPKLPASQQILQQQLRLAYFMCLSHTVVYCEYDLNWLRSLENSVKRNAPFLVEIGALLQMESLSLTQPPQPRYMYVIVLLHLLK